jgi:hypothetical protein
MTLKLFTFCVDIHKWPTNYLTFALDTLVKSLERFTPDFELLVFTNYVDTHHNPNVEIRPYYEGIISDYYQENQDEKWLNLSFNKLSVYRDLYEEFQESYTWIDLDTIICSDLSYLNELENAFVGTCGDISTPHPLFIDDCEYHIPYQDYIQGNLWKITPSLYGCMMEILDELNDKGLKLQYDCQSLFNYCYHFLDYDFHILGQNIYDDKVYGLGVWSNDDFSIKQSLILDLVFEKGVLTLKTEPNKEIHVWSFTFANFISIMNTKTFHRLGLFSDT